MDKGLFLYNPKSGDQSIKNRIDYIIKKFQQSNIFLIPFRMFDAVNNDDNLQRLFRSEKFSFIALSGGDGSLNYLVNFLMKNGINLPLGIFPCGTCNDFARGIGMTDNMDEWINVIAAGKTRIVDTGCINNDRYFIGNIGGGVFAGASFNTNNEIKRALGPAAYYLKALGELPQIESFNILVKTENCVIEENVILFIILNGRNVAGFSNFLKEADISDGLFDILLFKNAKPVELVNILLKMVSSGLSGDRNIIYLRAGECRLESDKKIQISVDGEQGPFLPLHVRCIQPGIRLFVNY
ncbi:MAG TPA: YegS/Rv2252/BmrU family lipid kinase [Clostridia bacterium]